MATAYSYDLMAKVMQFIEGGHTIIETSKIFGISRKAIFDWKKLQKETGYIKPKEGNRNGHSHSVTDIEAFQKFLDTHPDKTAVELADLWPDPISRSTILRWKKKLGYSYKKNVLSPRNQLSIIGLK